MEIIRIARSLFEAFALDIALMKYSNNENSVGEVSRRNCSLKRFQRFSSLVNKLSLSCGLWKCVYAIRYGGYESDKRESVVQSCVLVQEFELNF